MLLMIYWEAEIALPTPNQNVPFVWGFPMALAGALLGAMRPLGPQGPKRPQEAPSGPKGPQEAPKGPKGQALGVLTEYLWCPGVLIEYHGSYSPLGLTPAKQTNKKKQKHKKKTLFKEKKHFFRKNGS